MYVNKINLKEIILKIKNNETFIFELINKLCDLSEKSEPYLKSLIPVENRRERLLSEAKELILKYPDKNSRPPLFGIPVGIKDLFRVDGFETRCGSKLPPDLFYGEEAESVKKLKNAGALIFGKTITTEFAYFEPNETRNPYNIEHTPGGSSSGSAASVAAGIIPAALGTQTIGSITRPAAYCGVFGFKPSYGRISTKGVIPFSQSADHVGILSQDIDSLELLASILCENWKTEEKSLKQKPVIGVLTGKYINQADVDIIKNYNKSVEYLKSQGFKTIEVDLFPDIEKINRIHRIIISSEFADVHREWFGKFQELYRLGSVDLINEGLKHSTEELIDAKSKQALYRNKIEDIRRKLGIDLWISPSTTTFPPKGMATGSPLMNLPWTFIGVPTITMPVFYDENEFPFGLQFANSFENDELLFKFVKSINIFI